MESYTMGEDAMVKAMIMALPERYDMTLNTSDMAPLIWALAAQVGYVELSDDMANRAMSLFSYIAETLGIEGI